jgi:glycosyltransferase involved in cell wall biosynthesis
MRVLHVYRTYLTETKGGCEEVIHQICRATSANGIENRILTLSKNPSPPILFRPEADVYRFFNNCEIASCGFSFRAFWEYRHLIKWADLIHYHFPYPFADILHTFWRVKKKSILTYHSDIIRQKILLTLYRPLMNHFLRKMDRIVATSPNYFATSDILKQYFHKVEVISLGLDENSLPESNEKIKQSVKQTVGTGFFLFIGVLRYYKGLHILIDAIENSNLHVVIAGAGPTEKELKRHVAKRGINNVTFLGYVSDEEKVELIKLSKGIVFPSFLRSEAFGVTLIEGAKYGKPLISTEIGTGTSYINIHNDTGLVIPPSDPKKLKEAMEYIIKNPNHARQMGKNARRRYKELFTGAHMGAKYIDLYNDVLGQENIQTTATII